MSTIGKYNGVSAYNLRPNAIDTREMNGAYTPNTIVQDGLFFSNDYLNPNCYSGTGTAVSDLSPNGNNSTIYGGLESTFSQNGTFDFDGVNDGIQTNTAQLLDYTNNGVGMGFWFNWDGGTQTQIFGEWFWNNGGGDRFGVRVFWVGTNLYAALLRPTNVNYFITSNVSAGTWYYVYLQNRYDGGTNWSGGVWLGDSSLSQLYQGVASSVVPASNNLSQPITIGAGAGLGNNYDGRQGEFHVYNNKFLTNDEVTRNYNATKKRYGY